MKTLELNLRGLKCPLPVLHTRKALRQLTAGDVLIVQSSDPLSPIDIPAAVAADGHELLEQTREGGGFIFQIRHSAK